MYISQYEIRRIFNQKNWNLAKKYYELDYVKEIEIDYDYEISCYHISAELNVYGRLCHCQFTLNKEGELPEFSCPCFYCDESIACAHIGAVLIQLENLEPAMFPYRWRKEDELYSAWELHYIDKVSQELINSYASDMLLDYAAPYHLGITDVKLIGELEFHRDTLSLEYKIGASKMYVLKDLDRFMHQIDHRLKVRYGKNMEFVHTLESFDEFSQKQIAFLDRAVKEYAFVQSYSGQQYRYLDLSSDRLDRFFELYRFHNEYLNIGQMEDKNTIFQIAISKNALAYEFNWIDSDMVYLSGKRYGYVLQNNGLYRMDSRMFHKVCHLMELLSVRPVLSVPLTRMKEFYYNVYRNVKPYVKFSGDSLEEFLPEDVDIKVYVDRYDDERISVDLVFVYGEDQRYHGFQDRKVHTERNYLEEEKAKACIMGYASVVNEDEQLALIDDDGDRSIAFLKQGLLQLHEFCEVYVSDTLKDVKIKSDVHMQIGVRMDAKLLSIKMDSFDIPKEEIYEVLLSYRRKKKYHKLKNGDFVDLESEEIKEASALLEDLHVEKKDIHSGEISLSRYHSLYVDSTLKSYEQLQVERHESFREIIAHISEIKDVHYPLPKTLRAQLRDYQITGYEWLKTMAAYGFGCILADDMGLGKTLQMIAILEDVKDQVPHASSIVVCPSSLILNWEGEVHKFSDRLTTCLVQGSASERRMRITEALDYDVVITSYDYMRRDHDLYENLKFHYVILDEAQYIKNQRTKNASSVKKLNGKYKVALTGTPIENSLAELWSIFDFLMPGYLYTYAFFQRNFESKIIRETDEKALTALKKMVDPFLLRRCKREVLKELPEKTENVLTMKFSEEEKKLYAANLAQIHKELGKKVSIKDFNQKKIMILAMMTRLRQICCDARLLYENVKEPGTKLIECLDLIETAAGSGKKILVFSSFTSILDLLSDALQKRQISYFKLTGSNKKWERHEMVEQFQTDDTSVFLISLKAGGTGLNLTAAEVVIHYDPWWNLSAQNQATDRAHRIGQKNSIQVYKLVMKDSIEEKIMAMQKRKGDLSDAMIQNSEHTITNMSQEEIMALFES